MVSFFQKYEYSQPKDFWLRSKITGELLKLNTLMCSLAKLKNRVVDWSRVLQSISVDLPEGVSLKMITLTYKGEGNWRPNHIRDFIKKMRRFCGDKLVAYAWVCEMQSRGEPHYHVMIAHVGKLWIPKPDSSGWWVHGMSRVQKSDGNIFYLYEYAKKIEQKLAPFPKGARKYSVVICHNYLSIRDRWLLHIGTLPKWLEEKSIRVEKEHGICTHFRRHKGGGWLCKETGEILFSDWEFVGLTEMGSDDAPYGIQKKQDILVYDGEQIDI